jgi:hypothetical protein
MHLLTLRGLNRAFIQVVDEHRKAGLPVVTHWKGKDLVPAQELGEAVEEAWQRIEELDLVIAQYRDVYDSARTERATST